MKGFENIEIIDISTKDGKLVALVSFQDTKNLENINNGYDTIEIPINPREIQFGAHDGMLVNQSVQENWDAVSEMT